MEGSDKVKPRSRPIIHIGYPEMKKRLFTINYYTIILTIYFINRDVIFKEDVFSISC